MLDIPTKVYRPQLHLIACSGKCVHPFYNLNTFLITGGVTIAFLPVASTNLLATVSIAYAILCLEWPHVLSTKERNPYKSVRNF